MATGDARRLMPTTQATSRATVLELFFDLVFTYALGRTAARAIEDFTPQPAGWGAVTVGAKLLLLLFAL